MNQHVFRVTASIATAASLASSFPASANLVTNGSFEDVSIPLATNQICTTDQAVYPYSLCTATDWTGNYQIGNGATIGRSGVSFGIPQRDPDGVDALILQSFNSVIQPIASQAIDVTSAGYYELSFYAANRSSPAGDNGPQTLTASWDGSPVTGGVYSALPSGWTFESLTVYATAGSNTLTFSGLPTIAGDVTAFVDAVSLDPAAVAPVPEPATPVMLLLGLGGMGIFSAFKRRRFDLQA